MPEGIGYGDTSGRVGIGTNKRRIKPTTATPPRRPNVGFRLPDDEAYNPVLAAAQAANQGDFSGQTTGTPGGPYAPPLQGTGQALTPFGQSFAPGAYNEAWANPEAVIQQWFNQRNLPEGGGGYAMAQDEAERLGILWLLLNNQLTPQQGTAGYLDFAGDYMANQFLPGGRGVSPADVAGSMFGAGPDSPVFQSLAAANLSPSQQVQNFLSTMAAGMGGNMPSPVLRTLLAQYQKAGDEFTAQRLTPGGATGSMTFMDYLTQQGIGANRFGA